MECLLCQNTISNNSDCIENALQIIKFHFLDLKKNAIIRDKELLQLQERNSKLTRAIRILQSKESANADDKANDAYHCLSPGIDSILFERPTKRKKSAVNTNINENIRRRDMEVDNEVSPSFELSGTFNCAQYLDCSNLSNKSVDSPAIKEKTKEILKSYKNEQNDENKRPWESITNAKNVEPIPITRTPEANIKVLKEDVSSVLRQSSCNPSNCVNSSAGNNNKAIQEGTLTKAGTNKLTLSKPNDLKLRQSRLSFNILGQKRINSDLTSSDDDREATSTKKTNTIAKAVLMKSNSATMMTMPLKSNITCQQNHAQQKDKTPVGQLRKFRTWLPGTSKRQELAWDDDDDDDDVFNFDMTLYTKVDENSAKSGAKAGQKDSPISNSSAFNTPLKRVKEYDLPPMTSSPPVEEALNLESSSIMIMPQESEEIIFLDDTLHDETTKVKKSDLVECVERAETECKKKLSNQSAQQCTQFPKPITQIKLETDMTSGQLVKQQQQILKENHVSKVKKDNNTTINTVVGDNITTSDEEAFDEMPKPIKIKKEMKSPTKNKETEILCRELLMQAQLYGRSLTDIEFANHIRKCRNCPYGAGALRHQTPEDFWNPFIASFAESDPRNEIIIDNRFVDKRK